MDNPTRIDTADPVAPAQATPAGLPAPPSVFALLRQVRQRERDRRHDDPDTTGVTP
jgi:hypothetical protein